MSKRSRWQPPIPAAFIGPPPTPPKPDQLRQGAWCQWRKCDLWVTSSSQIQLPFCPHHINFIVDAVDEARTDHQERLRLEAEQAAATKAAAEAKVEAGQPLSPGERVPGHIYYIQVDDLVKIGYSENVARRIAQYPPNATVLALRPGTRRLERNEHSRFCGDLAKGREWFHPSTALMTHIEELVAEHGPVPDHLNDRLRDAGHYQVKRVVAGKRINRRW